MVDGIIVLQFLFQTENKFPSMGKFLKHCFLGRWLTHKSFMLYFCFFPINFEEIENGKDLKEIQTPR